MCMLIHLLIYVHCRFGDVRSQMCKYIVELWHKLDMKKGNFIPNMIGPFLKLSLLKEKGIII